MGATGGAWDPALPCNNKGSICSVSSLLTQNHESESLCWLLFLDDIVYGILFSEYIQSKLLLDMVFLFPINETWSFLLFLL